MDITYAIERVTEIKQKKKQIEVSLDLLAKGYTIEADKKYRVKLVAPELVGDVAQDVSENTIESESIKAPTKTKTPRGLAVHVQLSDTLVTQLLSQELEHLNKELELLSPVIDVANNMVREALQSIN